MDEKEILDCLNRYAAYMDEIKKRMDVVSNIYEKVNSGSSVTGYIETDIDVVYLQLRKIIELVMFACIVANKSAGLALNKTLRKGYEIQKIKTELQRFNVDFFPSPKLHTGVTEENIIEIDDLKQEVRPFLSEPELFRAYGIAGNYLHSQRQYQYGSPAERIKILRKGVEYVNQITHLLDHHWTNITKDSSFAVTLNRHNNKATHVALLVREDQAP
jgi:hypothetical protein